MPVLNQLEPGALSLTPFEVVSGVAHDDVVVTPWRYIQREYAVRLLSDGFFGQDVTIPALTVTYNLQERGSGSQGRDQTYILPALPMRILSLVPKSADDIRDASGQTFASIESRRFRSSLATTTAWIAFAFAFLFGIFAIVRAAGQFRAKHRGVVKPLPASSLLGACLSALARVKDDASQAGWTSELSRRAAAALRIAGAVALGRPVSQSVVGPDANERDGQLTVYSGWPRRRRVLLSAATTSRTITSGLSNGHGPDARDARQPRIDLRGARRAEHVRLRPSDERGFIGARQRAGREHAGRAAHSRRHAVAASHGSRH